MSRGSLTEEIEKLSIGLLGEKITTRQLRLMPYLQFCAVNDQQIDRQKINDEEGKILTDWRLKGFIGGHKKLTMTKHFWDALNQIIWLGYVNY